MLELECWSLDEQARRFSNVQRTAAAEGDNAVTLMLHKGRSCFVNVILDRIGMNSGIDKPGLIPMVAAQNISILSKVEVGNKPGSVHQQRAIDL
jgi:hypothetical protein